MTRTKIVICPYCGSTQPASERCRDCAGFFDPLSRQATHNEMGPWYLRDDQRPFRPGCSYETLVRLVERGDLTKYSMLRGPTTKQFWTVAKHVPGVAHLLGFCHACDATVDSDEHGCPECGVPFGAYLDRNYLGLPEVQPLPGEAPMFVHVAESSRQMPARWGGHRMAHTGISSFAADDELLAPSARSAHAHPAPGDHAAGIAGPVAPNDVGPGSGPHGEQRDRSALRAAQRRLARLQRTTRLLALLLLLVLAASTVIGFAAVGAIRRARDEAATARQALTAVKPATVAGSPSESP